MEFDVTVDRDIYIGGSDIPAIMGISPFKTRYELLCEKAGLRENPFQGNKYTLYGQKLEPQIRDYINAQMPSGAEFEPNRTICGDIRCHTDGFNGQCVLEIKTTSTIYEDIGGYKVYLVQLLKYMEVNGVSRGMLAVYQRDDSTTFKPENLSVYGVDIGDYRELLKDINEALERFRSDLERLRANPLLCEQDFQPNELVMLSDKVMVFENRMAEYRELERQYKEMKQALYEAMVSHDVKSWQTPNGTRITRVDGTNALTETVAEFDIERFRAEQPELYEQYQRQVVRRSAGRKGFVKITLPRGTES